LLRPGDPDRTFRHTRVLRRPANVDAYRGPAAADRRPAYPPRRVAGGAGRYDGRRLARGAEAHQEACAQTLPLAEVLAPPIPPARIAGPVGRRARRRFEDLGQEPLGLRAGEFLQRDRKGRDHAARGRADLFAPVVEIVAGPARHRDVADAGVDDRSHHSGALLFGEITSTAPVRPHVVTTLVVTTGND